MYNGVVLDIGSPNNVNNDLDSFWNLTVSSLEWSWMSG